MVRAIAVGLSALLLSMLAPPVAAGAAGEPTRFAVIATTQGSEPDTSANFIRLYERSRAQFGAPIGIRLFSPGQLPLASDRSANGEILTWAAREHPEEIITVSHKTRDEARLGRFLDWVLDHRLRVSVIYFHEVQDDWFGPPEKRVLGAEPENYKAAYRAYRSVIAAHRAASQVTLEKNLTWYWQHYRAKTKGGDWHAYVEAGDPADVLSWDTYVFPGMPTQQGHYAKPDEFFRYARDAWVQYGLAWGVGEIGTAVERGWDPDGAVFAAWVRKVTAAAADPARIAASYRGMPPARFVKWWHGKDAHDVDLSLDQNGAALAAYRASVLAS